jgi:hypothetical protein
MTVSTATLLVSRKWRRKHRAYPKKTIRQKGATFATDARHHCLFCAKNAEHGRERIPRQARARQKLRNLPTTIEPARLIGLDASCSNFQHMREGITCSFVAY